MSEFGTGVAGFCTCFVGRERPCYVHEYTWVLVAVEFVSSGQPSFGLIMQHGMLFVNSSTDIVTVVSGLGFRRLCPILPYSGSWECLMGLCHGHLVFTCPIRVRVFICGL